MSIALLSIFPQDVAQQVNGYAIQLSVSQRLTNGWKDIHDEMSWRGGHADSCDFHWCKVDTCTCYHKFPGFLLRRVNSNWIPVNGTIIPTAMLELETQADWVEYWNELDWVPGGEIDYDHDADYREDQAMAWM
jgi:hypothetical protein